MTGAGFDGACADNLRLLKNSPFTPAFTGGAVSAIAPKKIPIQPRQLGRGLAAMSDDPKQNPWSQVIRYLSLATMIPISGVAGYFIGYAIDKALGTHFLAIVLLILGTIGGFIQLIYGLGKE